MTETSPGSVAFDRLSPLAARLVLLLLVLVMVALVAFSLPMTEPVRRAGPSDLDTYERVVSALKAGQDYYTALHEALRAGDYGTTSPLNWRLPGFLTLLSLLPSLAVAHVALGVFTGLVWGFGVYWAWQRHGVRLAAGVGLALALSLIAIAAPRAELSFELFAGSLILVSFLAYGRGWWGLGVAAALLALFFRELAAVYLLICFALALKERRWAEIWVLLVAGLAFAAFYAFHAFQAMHLLGPDDHAAAMGWLQFGGLDFIIRTTSFNGLLLVLPYAAGALLLAPGLTGLLREPRGLLTVLAYLALFAVYGRPENAYWGALYAPLLAIGVALAPGVIVALVRRARAVA